MLGADPLMTPAASDALKRWEDISDMWWDRSRGRIRSDADWELFLLRQRTVDELRLPASSPRPFGIAGLQIWNKAIRLLNPHCFCTEVRREDELGVAAGRTYFVLISDAPAAGKWCHHLARLQARPHDTIESELQVVLPCALNAWAQRGASDSTPECSGPLLRLDSSSFRILDLGGFFWF